MWNLVIPLACYGVHSTRTGNQSFHFWVSIFMRTKFRAGQLIAGLMRFISLLVSLPEQLGFRRCWTAMWHIEAAQACIWDISKLLSALRYQFSEIHNVSRKKKPAMHQVLDVPVHKEFYIDLLSNILIFAIQIFMTRRAEKQRCACGHHKSLL